MKLQEVYKETLDEFNAISNDCELLEKLKCHIKAVKESGGYKMLNVRIACDIMRCRIGTQRMCDWYRKYGCNDEHITTLALRCMRESKLDELL